MRLRAHLGVFLICLGLVARWTWPLARDPAHLLPENTDPYLFSWVMISVFGNLLTRPALLLHGSGFYPYGASLTYAEPLVTPALLAGPLFMVTGHPYLAYNLTLLLFWAVSGWAAYAVTYGITRRHPAAAAAMLVFTLAPPRIQYAVEFQMEILFGLPLAVYALVRYLESQRTRYLLAFLVAFWLQAIAVWYFAVILGCGLVVLATSYVLRHWSGWRPRTLVAAAAGGVALVVALVPVAWPFFVTRAELGLQRDLAAAMGRSADVLSYVSTVGHWLARFAHIRRGHETSLFPGLVAFGLAALAFAWLRPRRPAAPAGGWPERLLTLAIAASVVVGVLSVTGGGRIRVGSAWTRLPHLTVCGVTLLGCLLLRDALAGWRRWRAGVAERRLTEGEWVSTLGAMALLVWLLSLGPVVPVAGYPTGSGLFAWLHPYVLPLQAIRSTNRFGLLVLLVLSILAGLGVAWLWARWRGPGRLLAMGTLLVVLALDYVHTPPRYQWIAGWTRPVDEILRADPDDVAVLEWRLGNRRTDVDAQLRSVGHGKRVVNGFAGFVLGFHRNLSELLEESRPRFASPAAQTALREIYGLRYLVVRDPARRWPDRPRGAAVAEQSEGFLRFRGSHGVDDLYEIAALPERGHILARWTSYDLLVSRPVLRARVQPLQTKPGVVQSVRVTLNGAPLADARLDGAVGLSAAVTRPLYRAAPNVIELQHYYGWDPAARGPAHRIGTTGVTSPVDVLVQSGSRPHGNVASIRIGMGEVSPNRRGYNLVALGPEGEPRGRMAFDTLADPAASGWLATWVRTLPDGSIVIGAVKDEASGQLGAEAIGALAMLGVAGDLRGRDQESHAFVGVKGARPGSALEALGARLIELRVGVPAAGFGLELTEFALEPAARVP